MAAKIVVMKTLFLIFHFSFFISVANAFEGTYAVSFKNEAGETSKLQVSVKDSLVLLKNISGGNKKYSSYIVNLNSDKLITLSKPDKKVAIVYPLRELLSLYEKNNLKDDYKTSSDIPFKATEKTKEENGIKQTRFTGEDAVHKSFLWTGETGFNFNQLIPLLRLIGFWNEAQLNEGTIFQAEVTSKVTKRTSTVSVVFKKESVSKNIFEVPKNYLQKDFEKLIANEKDNASLKTVIQTFAEF